MSVFHCSLILLNKNEWLQHATDIVKSRKLKSPEELLRDILTFDFKFGAISQ